MRIAVVATPRSGNTWLRQLLVTLYPQAAGMAVHNPAELDWDHLPPDCVLQVHWQRTPWFVERLEKNGFQVVTLARHPLSLLVSILQFVLHDASSARWLEGEEGNERSIYGAMPCSAAFWGYATGPRAAALLSLSRQWWQTPGCYSLRYEDLVSDTAGRLNELVQWLGVTPPRSVEEAIAANTLHKLRQNIESSYHFWQGQPDGWRCLLPPREAQLIAKAHAANFALFGYDCNPDTHLSVAQADANWIKLVWAELAEKIQQLRQNQKAFKQLQESQDSYRTAKEAELSAIQGTCRAQVEKVNSLNLAVANLEREAQSLRTRLRSLEQLGAFPLAVAARLRRLMDRFPTMTCLGKLLLGKMEMMPAAKTTRMTAR